MTTCSFFSRLAAAKEEISIVRFVVCVGTSSFSLFFLGSFDFDSDDGRRRVKPIDPIDRAACASSFSFTVSRRRWWATDDFILAALVDAFESPPLFLFYFFSFQVECVFESSLYSNRKDVVVLHSKTSY